MYLTLYTSSSVVALWSVETLLALKFVSDNTALVSPRFETWQYFFSNNKNLYLS